MATLSITNRYLAFDDAIASNNPQKKNFDWSTQLQGIVVDNPSSTPFRIPAGQCASLFDGTRTIGYDATTAFSLNVLNIAPNRYRLKWTGVGTAPTFRTDRAVSFTSSPPVTLTITPQLNQAVVITCSLGAIFGSVVVGDIVYIPGQSTGDSSSPFNTLNEGYWSVLHATTTQLTLVRMPNTVYSAKGEVVTIAANSSFQVFSADGVQLDDTLALVQGFDSPLIQNYEIVAVTANSLDFISGTTLANIASVVPGSNSIIIFSDAKSWVALETDQNIDITLNSNSTASFTVEPFLAGDPTKVGTFQLAGTVFSLKVLNKSSTPATVRIFTVE